MCKSNNQLRNVSNSFCNIPNLLPKISLRQLLHRPIFGAVGMKKWFLKNSLFHFIFAKVRVFPRNIYFFQLIVFD